MLKCSALTINNIVNIHSVDCATLCQKDSSPTSHFPKEIWHSNFAQSAQNTMTILFLIVNSVICVQSIIFGYDDYLTYNAFHVKNIKNQHMRCSTINVSCSLSLYSLLIFSKLMVSDFMLLLLLSDQVFQLLVSKFLAPKKKKYCNYISCHYKGCTTWTLWKLIRSFQSPVDERMWFYFSHYTISMVINSTTNYVVAAS